MPLSIRLPAEPHLAAWRGAAAFAAGPGYARVALTRAEYMEHGSARLRAEYEKHPPKPPKGRLW
jgi:actin-related protein